MKENISSLLLVFMLLFFISTQNRAQQMPHKGDLIISEFMVNPSAVSDTKGEWIELFNLSKQELILNGLVLSDSGSNTHTISSEPELVLTPGQYLILGRSDVQTENGGLVVNYVYANFSLGNTEDEIILSLPDGVVLDAIRYDATWPVLAGASLELDPGILLPDQNDNPDKWHPGTDLYGDGDLGSPGRRNSISTGIFNQGRLNFFEVFPNPSQGQIFIRISTKNDGLLSLNLISLLGQKIPILEQSHHSDLVIPLDLSGWDQGFYWLEARVGTEVYVQKLLIQPTHE